MAKSKVIFHCGCGYKTTKLSEAVAHVDSTEHTLDASGVILPDSKVKEAPDVYQRLKEG